MKQVIILIFLSYGTYKDIRYFCISKKYLLLFGITAVVFYLLEQREGFYELLKLWELLISIIPGIMMLLVSYATKEQIGYGDGVILMILGVLLGWKELLLLLGASLIIVMMVSVVVYLFRNSYKYTSIPFIPFLLLSFLIGMA